MPNHTIVEVEFPPMSAADKLRILGLLRGIDNQRLDFRRLLPIPANYWQGGAGSAHCEFPGIGLDWCSSNWGTKWNAYGIDGEGRGIIEHDDGGLMLVFFTAWDRPLGWLCALFNVGKVPFVYRYYVEGSQNATHGRFWIAEELGSPSNKWGESPAGHTTFNRLLDKLSPGWDAADFPFDGPDEDQPIRA